MKPERAQGIFWPTMEPGRSPEQSARLRWWPCGVVVFSTIAALLVVRWQSDWPFQQRNILTAQILGLSGILLLVWWSFFSRARKRLRQTVTGSILVAVAVGAALFRMKGVSGDLVPVFEFRWGQVEPRRVAPATSRAPATDHRASFPQFYGPDRDGVLAGPVLATNWGTAPPEIVWRQPVGAGWSGFAVAGDLCLTQEQQGPDECVVARSLGDGSVLWRHRDHARFGNPVAGEGPRATPTIVEERVFTMGSSGLLNCLDLATGKLLWLRNVVSDSGGKIPTWGAAGSPLAIDNLVVVHGGENGSHSLFAYSAADGTPVWKAGQAPSYASPIHLTLAGVPQVVAFNDGTVSGHDPRTGGLLWQRPWGNGEAVCSTPVAAGPDSVLFSSGYGVGTELLRVVVATNGAVKIEQVWKSIRLKSKFAHIFIRGDSVFGLDDGRLACVRLADGAQLWKGARYGHGQGLAVGPAYLLMSEAGELVLLHPTAQGPNEIARFRVFSSKTWNPLALVGDLLLVRNDREAACLRLPLAHGR